MDYLYDNIRNYKQWTDRVMRRTLQAKPEMLKLQTEMQWHLC